MIRFKSFSSFWQEENSSFLFSPNVRRDLQGILMIFSTELEVSTSASTFRTFGLKVTLFKNYNRVNKTGESSSSLLRSPSMRGNLVNFNLLKLQMYRDQAMSLVIIRKVISFIVWQELLLKFSFRLSVVCFAVSDRNSQE